MDSDEKKLYLLDTNLPRQWVEATHDVKKELMETISSKCVKKNDLLIKYVLMTSE